MINSNGIRITFLTKGHSCSLGTRPQEKCKEGHRPVVTWSPKDTLLYLNLEHQAPRDSRPQPEVDSTPPWPWELEGHGQGPGWAQPTGGGLTLALLSVNSLLVQAAACPLPGHQLHPLGRQHACQAAGLPEPRAGAHLGSWAAPGGPRANSVA